jgi:sialate O-acetylesterase
MLNSRVSKILIIVAFFVGFHGVIFAGLWVPAIFSNGMVIQRGKPFTIWGRAQVGESITVSLAGTRGQCTVTEDGLWRITLNLPEFTGTETLHVQGAETKIIKDVLLGEVWLASGQSNMEFQIAKLKDGGSDVLAAGSKFPIRFFKVTRCASAIPMDDVKGSWLAPNKWNSAVAYFFAKALQKELKCPVGIIQSGWSGSAIEPWIPYKRLKAMPAANWKVKKYEKFLATNTDPVDTVAVTGSKAASKRPAHLYNGMIHPLAGYSCKGVIWYQGESNVGQPYAYSLFCPEMLRAWRAAWQDPTLGFFPVQLANYRARQEYPCEGGVAQLREAQLSVLSMPYTGASTAVDVGDADDIHPKNKKPVGDRLAMAALHTMYGRDDLPAGCPSLDDVLIHDGEVIITVKNIGSGLVYRPNDNHSGFAMQGADGKWHWAKVTILNNQLHIRSDAVAKPIYVCYGWANNPCLSIFSRKGLPLLPFRTDKIIYKDANKYKKR